MLRGDDLVGAVGVAALDGAAPGGDVAHHVAHVGLGHDDAAPS